MPQRRLLARLNPEQRRAVETIEGPLLVLAGAGTGKTRVITYRIAYLLATGVQPENVLATTFTKKAAGEMRERVAALVGKEKAKRLTIGTFHAFCIRAIRRHAKALELPPNFAICDAGDQLNAVKGALRELRVAEAVIHPRALHSKISLLKNQLITPDAFLDKAMDDEDQLIGRAYLKYEEHLRRSRSIDFDDLLVRMVELLRKHDAIRGGLEARFRYQLVDEFQDTNQPQFEIVRRIAGSRRNLCVVGDDDQSIYGWRGADVRKILDFERHFPGAVTVRLETNYRSTEQILDAANAVISNNPSRHGKTLRAHHGSGEDINFVVAEDEEREAEAVVFDLLGKRARRDLDWRDFAVLFRTAPQARVFEMLLRQHDVPYVLVGGQSFFDRKEVRDLLAFVKLMSNPRDEVSFLRIANVPPRGIGKGTIDKLLVHATKNGVSVPHALEEASRIPDLPPRAVESIGNLRGLLANLAANRAGLPLVSVLRKLVAEVDYQVELVRCYEDVRQREARGTAIVEFLNMAENYERRADVPSLAGFLEEVALSESDDRSKDDDSRRDAVTLMTLHAAKGLEFPHVYLVGLEEGLLPHARSVAEDTVEEERRLAYVGVTRAQKRLTVSRAESRARFGKRTRAMPSRFMFEMRGETPPEDWVPAGQPIPEAPPRPGAKPTKKPTKRKRRGPPTPPGLRAARERQRRSGGRRR